MVGDAGSAWAAAGDLDPTFGGDGKVTTPFFTDGNASASVHAIAFQPDGKVIAAGSASASQNNGGGATSEFALARYNADGSLDASFSGDGKVTTDVFGGQDHARGVAVQPDGKIVAVGAANINAASFFNAFTIVRYNANGSLDTTFGTGGKVGTDLFGNSSEASSVVLQPDGRIVVAGFANDGTANRFALARYNTNGSLDTTFGTAGKVSTSFFGFDDAAAAVALQPDGRIVAVGHAYPGAANDQFAVARYNADGSLDAGFGSGGKVTTDFFGANDLGHAVLLQPDGKIVAAGMAYVAGTGIDQFALARYNADGNLDGSFGTGGRATTEFSSAYARRLAAARQADGKIVTASWGVDSATGLDHLQLARFDADGILDPTFSADGKLTTTFFGSQNQAYALAVQPDGRIVAGGSAYDPSVLYGQFALARYDGGSGTAPGATLGAVAVSPTSVVGGSAATGTVMLSAAAPSGGATVALASNSASASVPASVTVTAGSTTAGFTISTGAVSASTAVTITGSYGGVSRSATLTATAPVPPAAPTLLAPANASTVAQPVGFDWSDVAGAVTYEIQVDDASTFAAPFRASQVVNASQVAIGGLPAQQLWWRVRARNAAGVAGSFSATRRLTPQAAPAAASLASVSVGPISVVGGGGATGTVTLTTAAPASGASVSLSSNSPAAGVPSSVTVTAGSTSATFAVTTSAVTTSTPATVSAAYAGITRTATLTVNPPAVGVTLTVSATGRAGQRVTSNPAGIDVTVGSSRSAGFAAGTSVTLSVAGGRDAIWTGACSSGGNKARTCTFTMTANASVTANVQ